MMSLFGSHLAGFDKFFTPKWSFKDLLIESIKMVNPPIHDMVQHPLQ
jgi:hypothetical protein